ncbi:heterokaryon incompatibility protein (HET) domain-containing protein [Sarocladium implicatum]|nr:heterokaryon incompatibility protein (HET) domain-containing protein [Sarocladium implicatum]
MSALCEYCTDLVRLCWQPSEEIRHYWTVGELRQSAQSCDLCRTIESYWPLAKVQARFSPELDSEEASSPLVLEFELVNTGQSEQYGTAWICLQGIIATVSLLYQEPYNFTITSRNPLVPARPDSLWAEGESSWHEKCRVIKSWYYECAIHHPECRPARGQLPGRLVDVGSEDRDPRVVKTTDDLGSDLRYTALSHCWGELHKLTATSATLDQLQQGLPIEGFPSTFEEAILLTRELGIPYIWIDSLCIIQDDPADWAREAERMKHTYAGCAVTISAADGHNSTHGCFIPDHPELYDAEESHARVASLSFLPHGEEDSDRDPIPIRICEGDVSRPESWEVLRQRGWTLQEEVLAHREIICRRPAMRWRCQRSYQTEAGHEFPVEVKRSIWGRDGSGELDPRIWGQWMTEYAQRSFTFEKDRFSALVGIVHNYHQRTGYHHVLASWRETMIQDLLWIAFAPVSTSSTTMTAIPSWSWLTRTRVAKWDWDAWRLNDADPWDLIQTKNHATVVEVDASWAGEPLLSELFSTRLVLEGPVRKMRLRVDPRGTDIVLSQWKMGDEEPVITKDDPTPWRYKGRFDQHDEHGDGHDVYTCLHMRSTSRLDDEVGRHMNDTFLVLVQVQAEEEEDGVFRRVGVGKVGSREKAFADAPKVTIRIV